MTRIHEYEVEQEYFTLGPAAVTTSEDGTHVALDFVQAADPGKALRLVFPAAALENWIVGLHQIQQALSNPEPDQA